MHLHHNPFDSFFSHHLRFSRPPRLINSISQIVISTLLNNYHSILSFLHYGHRNKLILDRQLILLDWALFWLLLVLLKELYLVFTPENDLFLKYFCHGWKYLRLRVITARTAKLMIKIIKQIFHTNQFSKFINKLTDVFRLRFLNNFLIILPKYAWSGIELLSFLLRNQSAFGNKLWLYIVENLILFELFENIRCFIKSDADFILISELNLAVLPQV